MALRPLFVPMQDLLDAMDRGPTAPIWYLHVETGELVDERAVGIDVEVGGIRDVEERRQRRGPGLEAGDDLGSGGGRRRATAGAGGEAGDGEAKEDACDG